ncbi:small oligopeptide transporter, OPT family [Ophiocordyceps camponoti-floridani]|uniref:Small oligopeptide transporter, OPT family n=1 Tax=Ophiocordyceps camponoti-floridani TaxID=2030778 RepID=A0A8H4VBJ7_9HYPO|nr:small oligopeptide transporter, OPT family [Ophiocordyceps camponoti-floridani]
MVPSVFRKRHEPEEVTPIPAALESNASGVDHLKHLHEFEKAHKLDPNLPIDDLNDVDAAIAMGNAEKGIEIEHALMEDNSPYPEVRAVVRNYDVDVPVNTIRAWVIGMLLCSVGSSINMIFSLRYPSITITTYVVQLIAYPIGRGWDMVMPDRVWNLCGLKFNLRPGKFNYKEHVIIVAMSNAAYGGGALYANDVIIAQKIFYGQDFGMAFQILFGITTLCTGYGLAGLARRFLVWPAAMIWPADLVNCALFYTLHDHSTSDPTKTNGWSIGRYKLFLIIFCGGFFYYWFPGWIFKGLSLFAWVCWLAPNNLVINKLFGVQHGYGLMPITFDWSIISGFINSPLIPPFHAIANVLGSIMIFFVIASIGIHFTGALYADYVPVQSSESYDNTGNVYNVSRVLDANYQFNETAYKEYSPLYLSTQFALSYGLSFAAMASVIIHVALYHGKEIWRQFRMARHQEDDVHMRLMKKYRDAEDWWYAALFIVMVAVSFGVVTGWPTGFPPWAFVICLLLPIVWLIPIGLIQAITNIQLGLNVLTELIIGYMAPGRPLVMMLFKNYGYISMSQALYFAQDLKLGHYMKVPPRVMFSSQLVASIWSATLQICVLNWALRNIPEVCTVTQPNNYSCPNSRVFYTASIVWGVIGPARIFSHGATYASLRWFWLVGTFTPVATWMLARRWPKSFWRYVCTPIIFGGVGLLPPATVYIYLCWGVVGVIFGYFIKRRYTGWWLQYNYITSAALDCGLVCSTLVIFFTLYLTSTSPPKWWGNDDIFKNLDHQNLAVTKRLPPGETFGPSVYP